MKQTGDPSDNSSEATRMGFGIRGVFRGSPNPSAVTLAPCPFVPSVVSLFFRQELWLRRYRAGKFTVKLSILLALLTASACRRDDQSEPPGHAPAPVPTAIPPPESVPTPTTGSTTDPAEVFRRAFWRHPTDADHILHAERRVNPDDNSWQWFIQLHPSPELLAALRDPDTLGLSALPPGQTPRSWTIPSEPPPAWFPAHDSLADETFEIRRGPASGLTTLYRAHDNTLFATDHGTGFAQPVR